MSTSFRTNRRLRRRLHKEAKGGIVIINLVSMIDMFTALVFFLLIITSSVVTMRNPNSLTLPNSVSVTPPKDSPVLIVTPTQISLQGQLVMTTQEAQHSNSEILAPLRARLLAVPLREVQAAQPKPGTKPGDGTPAAADKTPKSSRGKINIMADKQTPYALLKKIMMTCGDVQFTDISLSVNHVPVHHP